MASVYDQVALAFNVANTVAIAVWLMVLIRILLYVSHFFLSY